VIPNQNLFRMATERTTWREAFKMADQVLYMGVRGVTDLMMAPGLVNLDFADIRTVMAAMGKAMMGTGEAEGENRAIKAAEAAINNPLLEDTSMSGARGLLINITGGDDLTLYEVDQAANRIREEVDEEAEIIFGSAIDETLQGKIRVSVVATGIDTPVEQQAQPPRLKVVGGEDHVVMPGTPRDAAFVLGGFAAGGPAQPGYAQPGYAQPGHAQPGHAQAGYAQAGYAQAGYAQSGAAVPQLRATASEQLAVSPMEFDAAAEVLPQDPPMPQDAPAQRVEPVMTPPVEQRQPAAQGSSGSHAPGSPGGAPRPQSPNVRGQGSTLFAPPQKLASASGPAAAPAPAEPHRSLFGLVTGVLGFRHAPEADVRTQPAEVPVTEAAGEQARPTVRQTTAEDIGIGIPKFLLRQTSGTAAPPRR
jgi:cell division protein FtsZ